MFYVFCLHVCMHIPSRPGAQGDQKKSSDPLKPELRVVVNRHVDAGNKCS